MSEFSDYGRIGGRLNFEYRKLDQFAQEIALGTLSEAQIQARVQLYANGARTAFFDGHRAANVDVQKNFNEVYSSTYAVDVDCDGFPATNVDVTDMFNEVLSCCTCCNS